MSHTQALSSAPWAWPACRRPFHRYRTTQLQRNHPLCKCSSLLLHNCQRLSSRSTHQYQSLAWLPLPCTLPRSAAATGGWAHRPHEVRKRTGMENGAWHLNSSKWEGRTIGKSAPSTHSVPRQSASSVPSVQYATAPRKRISDRISKRIGERAHQGHHLSRSHSRSLSANLTMMI